MVGVKGRQTKTFVGGRYLRQRLVLSTLSGTAIRVTGIHEEDSTTPGLSGSEISLIRLLDKVTSQSRIQINETGTSLYYKPGLLVGGEDIEHDCHGSRGLGYYLEPLLMLAPFCKHGMRARLRGATHGEADMCVDSVRAVSIPLLRKVTGRMGVEAGLEVVKRGVVVAGGEDGEKKKGMKGGGGEVLFRSEAGKGKVEAVDLMSCAVVKRVRGVAFGNGVSPGLISRMVDRVRGLLNRFCPDVYVHTDHGNERSCGTGMGLQLGAETVDGGVIGADWSCGLRKNGSTVSAEEVAELTVGMLLEEVKEGGCVDRSNARLALMLCAVAEEEVSRVRLGKLDESVVWLLRDIEEMLGVRFQCRVRGGAVSDGEEAEGEEEEEVEEEEGLGTVMSCVGVGLTNVARRTF